MSVGTSVSSASGATHCSRATGIMAWRLVALLFKPRPGGAETRTSVVCDQARQAPCLPLPWLSGPRGQREPRENDPPTALERRPQRAVPPSPGQPSALLDAEGDGAA